MQSSLYSYSNPIIRIVLVFLFTMFSTKAALSAEVPPSLLNFLNKKSSYAAALSEPIIHCVNQFDTEHPVFHGCIDWHSSVHGNWALLYYWKKTNNEITFNTLQNLLDGTLIDQESEQLSENINFEMPYGRAWLLRLSIEAQNTIFETLPLMRLANEAADSLVSYYSANKASLANENSYRSDSWALINLLKFGETTQQEQYSDFAKNVAREALTENKICPNLIQQTGNTGFMPHCLNWAWLGLEVTELNNRLIWINDFLPNPENLNPVSDSARLHRNGLNFSRAWALWEIYNKTGNLVFLDLFIKHFEKGFGNDRWLREYSHGHWIPQFGMFAISRTPDFDGFWITD